MLITCLNNCDCKVEAVLLMIYWFLSQEYSTLHIHRLALSEKRQEQEERGREKIIFISLVYPIHFTKTQYWVSAVWYSRQENNNKQQMYAYYDGHCPAIIYINNHFFFPR